MDPRTDLPQGTLTLLFTDIVGSTALLSRLGQLYDQVLSRHRAIVRNCVGACGGIEVDTQGDSFFFVFTTASMAARAALAIAAALAGEQWPESVRVSLRMGLHTGEPTLGSEGYLGMDVHRASRIAHALAGEGILVSETTEPLLRFREAPGFHTHELGVYQLKDLGHPETLFALRTSSADHTIPGVRAEKLDRPTELDPFAAGIVGRERHSAELLELVQKERLVTVIGPGGAGKTSLARLLFFSDELQKAFPARRHWIDLSSSLSEQACAEVFSSTLGYEDGSDNPRLPQSLRESRALVLVDNAEHVIEPVRKVLSSLLGQCPLAHVVVTSRQTLRLAMENIFTLPELDENAAVALFMGRARQKTPGFGTNPSHERIARKIVKRLERHPLSLELAAAKLRTIGIEALDQRLDEIYSYLDRGPVDLPQRQQGITQLVDWSYRLLDPAEQSMLRKLSAFAGSWTLAAFEAVAGRDSIEVLESLVDKSLVRFEDEHSRYDLFESIRAFARARLSAEGELVEAKTSISRYFLAYVTQLDPLLRSSSQDFALSRLEKEAANIRDALEFLSEHDPGAHTLLSLALWRYWRMSSKFGEGSRHLELALSSDPELGAESKARILIGLGSLYNYRGDFARSLPHFESALALVLPAEHSQRRGEILNQLTVSLALTGRLGEAELAGDESIAIAGRDNHRRANALFTRSYLDLARADSAGIERLEEAIELRGEKDLWWSLAARLQKLFLLILCAPDRAEVEIDRLGPLVEARRDRRLTARFRYLVARAGIEPLENFGATFVSAAEFYDAWLAIQSAEGLLSAKPDLLLVDAWAIKARNALGLPRLACDIGKRFELSRTTNDPWAGVNEVLAAQETMNYGSQSSRQAATAV